MPSRTRRARGQRPRRPVPARRSPRRSRPAHEPFFDADLPPAEFRRLGHHAIDLLAEYYAGLRARRILPVTPGPPPFAEPLPQRGADPRHLLDRWTREVVPASAHLGSPRFFGYVHGSGLQLAALADLLAAGQNSNVADRRMSPAESEIERCVVRWIAEMIGYPADCGGSLVSGGMAANLEALLVALRATAPFDSAEEGLQSSHRQGRFLVYMNGHEGHVTIRRAADFLNLGRGAVRDVPFRDDFTMDPEALRRMIGEDRARGDQPFCVVAQAGSINVGATDPLPALADLCGEQGLWLHVDGAAGAFGALLPELRDQFVGLERADSVTVDPHKWLYLPKECGALLVREEARLRQTFRLEAAYLERQEGPTEGGENYRSLSMQSSRGFRALKVWMALQQLGTEGYLRLFRQNLACVARLDRRVRDDPDFEALHAPRLFIYSFRYRPRELEGGPGGPGLTLGTSIYLDRLNDRIVERTNRTGIVFLTTTKIRGRTALRVSVCNHRTRPADIDRLFALLKQTGARLHAEALRDDEAGARP